MPPTAAGTKRPTLLDLEAEQLKDWLKEQQWTDDRDLDALARRYVISGAVSPPRARALHGVPHPSDLRVRGSALDEPAAERDGRVSLRAALGAHSTRLRPPEECADAEAHDGAVAALARSRYGGGGGGNSAEGVCAKILAAAELRAMDSAALRRALLPPERAAWRGGGGGDVADPLGDSSSSDASAAEEERVNARPAAHVFDALARDLRLRLSADERAVLIDAFGVLGGDGNDDEAPQDDIDVGALLESCGLRRRRAANGRSGRLEARSAWGLRSPRPTSGGAAAAVRAPQSPTWRSPSPRRRAAASPGLYAAEYGGGGGGAAQRSPGSTAWQRSAASPEHWDRRSSSRTASPSPRPSPHARRMAPDRVTNAHGSSSAQHAAARRIQAAERGRRTRARARALHGSSAHADGVDRRTAQQYPIRAASPRHDGHSGSAGDGDKGSAGGAAAGGGSSSRGGGGDGGGSGSSGGNGDGGSHGEEDVAPLVEENSRLRAELAQFNLGFFEEVEDLKFEYARLRAAAAFSAVGDAGTADAAPPSALRGGSASGGAAAAAAQHERRLAWEVANGGAEALDALEEWIEYFEEEEPGGGGGGGSGGAAAAAPSGFLTGAQLRMALTGAGYQLDDDEIEALRAGLGMDAAGRTDGRELLQMAHDMAASQGWRADTAASAALLASLGTTQPSAAAAAAAAQSSPSRTLSAAAAALQQQAASPSRRSAYLSGTAFFDTSLSPQRRPPPSPEARSPPPLPPSCREVLRDAAARLLRADASDTAARIVTAFRRGGDGGSGSGGSSSGGGSGGVLTPREVALVLDELGVALRPAQLMQLARAHRVSAGGSSGGGGSSSGGGGGRNGTGERRDVLLVDGARLARALIAAVGDSRESVLSADWGGGTAPRSPTWQDPMADLQERVTRAHRRQPAASAAAWLDALRAALRDAADATGGAVPPRALLRTLRQHGADLDAATSKALLSQLGARDVPGADALALLPRAPPPPQQRRRSAAGTARGYDAHEFGAARTAPHAAPSWRGAKASPTSPRAAAAAVAAAAPFAGHRTESYAPPRRRSDVSGSRAQPCGGDEQRTHEGRHGAALRLRIALRSAGLTVDHVRAHLRGGGGGGSASDARRGAGDSGRGRSDSGSGSHAAGDVCPVTATRLLAVLRQLGIDAAAVAGVRHVLTPPGGGSGGAGGSAAADCSGILALAAGEEGGAEGGDGGSGGSGGGSGSAEGSLLGKFGDALEALLARPAARSVRALFDECDSHGEGWLDAACFQDFVSELEGLRDLPAASVKAMMRALRGGAAGPIKFGDIEDYWKARAAAWPERLPEAAAALRRAAAMHRAGRAAACEDLRRRLEIADLGLSRRVTCGVLTRCLAAARLALPDAAAAALCRALAPLDGGGGGMVMYAPLLAAAEAPPPQLQQQQQQQQRGSPSHPRRPQAAECGALPPALARAFRRAVWRLVDSEGDGAAARNRAALRRCFAGLLDADGDGAATAEDLVLALPEVEADEAEVLVAALDGSGGGVDFDFEDLAAFMLGFDDAAARSPSHGRSVGVRATSAGQQRLQTAAASHCAPSTSTNEDRSGGVVLEAVAAAARRRLRAALIAAQGSEAAARAAAQAALTQRGRAAVLTRAQARRALAELSAGGVGTREADALCACSGAAAGGSSEVRGGDLVGFLFACAATASAAEESPTRAAGARSGATGGSVAAARARDGAGRSSRRGSSARRGSAAQAPAKHRGAAAAAAAPAAAATHAGAATEGSGSAFEAALLQALAEQAGAAERLRRGILRACYDGGRVGSGGGGMELAPRALRDMTADVGLDLSTAQIAFLVRRCGVASSGGGGGGGSGSGNGSGSGAVDASVLLRFLASAVGSSAAALKGQRAFGGDHASAIRDGIQGVTAALRRNAAHAPRAAQQ